MVYIYNSLCRVSVALSLATRAARAAVSRKKIARRDRGARGARAHSQSFSSRDPIYVCIFTRFSSSTLCYCHEHDTHNTPVCV